MSKGRLLVVEDDFDISNMLRIYFTGQGFDVAVAPRGGEALELTRRALPNLILLDIMLPDMDGYSVCRNLRTTIRTSHIPILFLTQRDERADRIEGLSLGADDYITKPFDIEELKLRVVNAINRQERENSLDPRTGLPSGRLIEDQLRRIVRGGDWAMLDLGIRHFGVFRDAYGFIAGDEVLRFTAMLLGEVIDEVGSAQDFIGHPGADNFLVISTPEGIARIAARLRERFNEEVLTHYSFVDREQGYVAIPNATNGAGQGAFMRLQAGVICSTERPFADIREITEVAAEARRADTD
jgi:DNA-binding response OmpR family regulator